MPTVSSDKTVIICTAEMVVTLIVITVDYYACALLSQAKPPPIYVTNRGFLKTYCKCFLEKRINACSFYSSNSNWWGGQLYHWTSWFWRTNNSLSGGDRRYSNNSGRLTYDFEEENALSLSHAFVFFLSRLPVCVTSKSSLFLLWSRACVLASQQCSLRFPLRSWVAFTLLLWVNPIFLLNVAGHIIPVCK